MSSAPNLALFPPQHLLRDCRRCTPPCTFITSGSAVYRNAALVQVLSACTFLTQAILKHFFLPLFSDIIYDFEVKKVFIPPLPQHSSLMCRNCWFCSPTRSRPSPASCETCRCGISVSLCCFAIATKLTVNYIRPTLWPAGRATVKLRKPKRILTQILASSSRTGALTLHLSALSVFGCCFNFRPRSLKRFLSPASSRAYRL